MRNPNGYGAVVKLSGNRRKPYAVRKTVGFTDDGKSIYKYIGYYATRKEAMMALADYNYNPYDLNRSSFTFEELYNEWSGIVLPKYKTSLQRSLISAHGHCKDLFNIEYRKLKRIQMQECIDKCDKSASTQTNIRNLFVKLDAYAYEMDIISKQYSQLLTIAENVPVRPHIPFTNEEIQILWAHEKECQAVLVMLYTGMRITEAATLPTDCIKDGLIQFGIKTKAGKDRIIPIHPAIKHIVDERMGNALLLGHGSVPSRNLRCEFQKVMKKYGMNHVPHDTRHTFRSELDRKGANKVCIDLIMGHSSKEIGERVYTHKTVTELIDTMALITYVP